jgi:DNA polymerase delta subunit 1
MYTNPETHDYIDVKGLQLVRRDNAPIVKDVSSAILDALMHERSAEKAIDAARIAVLRVLTGQEPMHKFVISKALKSNYVNPASHPHVVVANKIRMRRGYPVASGERVAYVFVEDKDKYEGLLSARAEDPEYVKEHPEVKLDSLYYINNQLMSPITTLLELLVPNVEETILGAPTIKDRIDALKKARQQDLKETKRVRINKEKNQHEITKFFFVKDT